MTFVVHLDGMREIHDYICGYPGLWDIAVDAIRAAVRKHGFRWLASPIYQDFLTGDRKLPCAPWGSITRNPYGWKGPCYLLTDGIFPTYDALLENIEWDSYGPGNDPRCEHCGIHSGFEPSAAYAATSSVKETVRSMAWTLTG
jgi:MoaA/NifB/PqqE/SkfB family radical SAM enzyme